MTFTKYEQKITLKCITYTKTSFEIHAMSYTKRYCEQ